MNQKSNSNRNNRSNGNRNNRNNKRRNFSKKRTNNNKKNKIQLDPLFRKYSILLEELIEARKKYYEMFYRSDDNRKNKLETQYSNKVKEFNDFQDSLNQEDKERIIQMFPSLKFDHTYSENHELDPSSSTIEVTNIEDPHLLEIQKNHNYSQDTEESTGSIEDYKAYKGL